MNILDYGKQLGHAEGHAEGRNEGIMALIRENIDSEVPEADIINKLQKYFSLSSQKAENYLKSF